MEPATKKLINNNGLSPKHRETLIQFQKTLHRRKPQSQRIYLSFLKKFGEAVEVAYEDVSREDIDSFLSSSKTDDSYNSAVIGLKRFYKWLDKGDIVKDLKTRKIRKTFTPSELLTPQEVMDLAVATGSPMYKALILTLYESAARINEILTRRIGDVTFQFIQDKDGQTIPVATIHFKDPKGAVIKEPVVVSMFAGELKAWIESHPHKEEDDAFIFYAQKFREPKKPLSHHHVWLVLKKAKKTTGITKKVNPHWLRHSMLSYLVNQKHYNEQLLKWRAGWSSTAMAKRYVHSGAELENAEYLRRQGFIIPEEEEKQIIKPKVCPHCSRSNPYTHINCDFCGMPLELKKYKTIIESKRIVESLDLTKVAELFDRIQELETTNQRLESQLKTIVQTYDKKFSKMEDAEISSRRADLFFQELQELKRKYNELLDQFEQFKAKSKD